VSLPPGEPVPPPTQVLLIEKQPEVSVMPPPNVDVAVPTLSSLNTVVEPVDESNVRNGSVVVANVVGDDVENEKILPCARRLNGALVDVPSVRVSCGRVDDESVNVHCGVVVPNPTAPIVDENALDATAPNEAPFLY
jgi:hypothetical protein